MPDDMDLATAARVLAEDVIREMKHSYYADEAQANMIACALSKAVPGTVWRVYPVSEARGFGVEHLD